MSKKSKRSKEPKVEEEAPKVVAKKAEAKAPVATPQFLGPNKVLVIACEDYLNPSNGRMYKRVSLANGTVMVLSELDFISQLSK